MSCTGVGMDGEAGPLQRRGGTRRFAAKRDGPGERSHPHFTFFPHFRSFPYFYRPRCNVRRWSEPASPAAASNPPTSFRFVSTDATGLNLHAAHVRSANTGRRTDRRILSGATSKTSRGANTTPGSAPRQNTRQQSSNGPPREPRLGRLHLCRQRTRAGSGMSVCAPTGTPSRSSFRPNAIAPIRNSPRGSRFAETFSAARSSSREPVRNVAAPISGLRAITPTTRNLWMSSGFVLPATACATASTDAAFCGRRVA